MPLYRALVKGVIRAAYAAVSSGRYRLLLLLCARDVEISVPGAHALGGVRRGRDAYRDWFALVFRLFRSLDLRPTSIEVRGGLRQTHAVVHWVDRVTAHDGTTFENVGTHLADLRWLRLERIEYRWNDAVTAQALEHAERLDPHAAARS
jgi:ketosteroid isomerase-like protein